MKFVPPIRRLKERLDAAEAGMKVAIERANASEYLLTRVRGGNVVMDSIHEDNLVIVTRGTKTFLIGASKYDSFPFENNDLLEIYSPNLKQPIVTTPDGNKHVMTANGAIRVPQKMELFQFRGFSLPAHLVVLTGSGPENWDAIGRAHIENYKKFMGLEPDMTFLEIGSGIGRDAFQLMEFLNDKGRYIGLDVTRDSISWCQRNLAKARSNFEFHHFDAQHELYNPLGRKTTMDFRLPAADKSVDRIALGSIFTHLFEDEVRHYMKEIRRVLKPGGLAYATFFLYSAQTIEAARRTNHTPFKLLFEHKYGNGCYINDAAYPTGAVAFTDDLMTDMISGSGLTLKRPYLKGWWSGAHETHDDGQEVAILESR